MTEQTKEVKYFGCSASHCICIFMFVPCISDD